LATTPTTCRITLFCALPCEGFHTCCLLAARHLWAEDFDSLDVGRQAMRRLASVARSAGLFGLDARHDKAKGICMG
jgi:hypothetical protein